MPSMSYSAIENTASELGATVDLIEEKGARYLKGVNQYERAAYQDLLALCKEFLELHEKYKDVIESWSSNDPVDEEDDEEDDEDEYEDTVQHYQFQKFLSEDWRSW